MKLLQKTLLRSLPILFTFSLTASATIIDMAETVYNSEVTHPEVLNINKQFPIEERQVSVVQLKKPVHLNPKDEADLIALKICQDTHPAFQGVTNYTVLMVSIFGRSKIREYFNITSVTCIGPKRSKLI